MANITLEEAFKLGIEAHKAGSQIEATNYYNVILQALPDHAVTNHNMGILNAGLGKHKESISYFRKALFADSQVEQFWVSYLGALLDLGQVKDAKALIQKAKSEDFSVGLVKKLEGLLAAKDSFLRCNPPEEIINQIMKLYNDGKLGEVVNQGQVLLKQYPEAYLVWNILGAANKSLGRIEKASDAFKQVTELNQNYADGFNNFGVTIKEQGKFDEAIEAYKKAVSLKPDYAEAYSNMGIVLKEKGKFDEAIEASKKAVSLKPDYAEAYFNIGDIFQVQGKLNEAIEAYKKSILLQPDYSAAYLNLGNILQKQNKLEEALEAFKKVLSIKPDYAEAYLNIGVTLQKKINFEESIEAFKKALSIKPDYAEAYFNMGTVLKEKGNMVAAIQAYKKAISYKPDYVDAHINMGVVLQNQDNVNEAIKTYKKILSFAPDCAAVHRNLSALIKYKPTDPHITEISKMLKKTNIIDADKCHLLYAYAKINEDLGNLKVAFESYVSGGKLRQKLIAYDPKKDELTFEQIKKAAPRIKEISHKQSIKLVNHTPIFILGMPRSGTTLVEQIISNHSQVHGAGELTFIDRFGAIINRGGQVANLENILKVRNSYLNELVKVSNQCSFVTDKMPQNFLYLGLILSALPEAKVIHVKRDPAATCWSNFKHYFNSDGLGYSYNLDDTINYFEMYQELMIFWGELYKGQFYDLDYERLTIDQEVETKKLIKYLTLDWEESCLSPHENKSNVRTASQQQVRKRVYKGSSEVWLNFKPHLNGIFDKLISI